MKCTFNKDLLQEYAIGEVNPAERGQVEEHLGACTECRLEITDLRRMVRDLSSLPEPDFPVDLEDVLIRAAVQAGRSQQGTYAVPRRSHLRPVWIYALAGGAGLVFVVFVVLLLWPGRFAVMGPGGGVEGQGIGLLDSVFGWAQNVRHLGDHQGVSLPLRSGHQGRAGRRRGVGHDAVGCARAGSDRDGLAPLADHRVG